MASSYPENIPLIIQTIARLKPKSVLDVGCGSGKYGVLMREYFRKRPNPEKSGWQEIPRIDALEVFKPYINNLHRSIYNKIHIGNVLEMKIPDYDLYLLIDTIEHWKKDEANELVEMLQRKGNVIISTPKSNDPQNANDGNKWGWHISHWSVGDFTRYNIEDVSNNISTVVLILKRQP